MWTKNLFWLAVLMAGSCLSGCDTSKDLAKRQAKLEKAPPQSAIIDSNPYKDKYNDQLEEGWELLESWYHFTVEKTEKRTYVKKQYHPVTKQMYSLVTYSNRALTVKDGPCRYWFDNGEKFNEGQFRNNQKVGKWSLYNFMGGKTEGDYVRDLRQGLWVSTDSLGQVVSEYNYNAGQRTGPFKVFDMKGQVVREGIYVKGQISRQESFETEGEVFMIAEKSPYMPGCGDDDQKQQEECSAKELLRYVYKELKYPPYARSMGIEGRAFFGFVINEKGQIEDIEPLVSICDEIRDEGIRVIKTLPPWNPGMADGQAVRVKFAFPIQFKLVN